MGIKKERKTPTNKGRSAEELSRAVFEKRLRVYKVIAEYHDRERVDPTEYREIDTPTLRRILEMNLGELHGQLKSMTVLGWVSCRTHLRKIGDPKDGKPKRPCLVWKPTGVVPQWIPPKQEGSSVQVQDGNPNSLVSWMRMPNLSQLKVVSVRVYGERDFERMHELHS